MTTIIPGKKRLSWYDRKGIVELITGLAAFGAIVVSSYQLYQDPNKKIYSYWTAGAFLIAALGFALKVRHGNAQDRKEIEGVDHDGIQGAMYVVHAAAAHACGLQLAEGFKTIRATFHRVIYEDSRGKISNPTEYEQVMDYVGRGGEGKNRRFPISVGISGLAVRLGDPIASERKNASIAEYQRELIEDWGYTPIAAKGVSTAPMSWLASPIRDSDTDKVIGIVYLDSTAPKAFEAEAVKSAILTACLGVTKYVEKRYKL